MMNIKREERMLAQAIRFWILLCVASFVWAEDEAAPPQESQYVELAPSFVANFGTGSGKLKYVKTEITLRVPSKAAVAVIEANLPLLRHEIVMLLSSQTQADMDAPNSQETIRLAALDAVQKAIVEETGTDQINDLLFISFVIQG